jgi:hypothetical protein
VLTYLCERGHHHEDDVIYKSDNGEPDEEEKPEPEEDVNLLVHDVDGQDADGVVGLHGAGRAKLVKVQGVKKVLQNKFTSRTSDF